MLAQWGAVNVIDIHFPMTIRMVSQVSLVLYHVLGEAIDHIRID